MQNPKTGMMEELSEEQYNKLAKEMEGKFHSEYSTLKFRDGSPVPANVAKFRVEETVTVNGGKFKVRKITKKDLVLRGIKHKEE